MKKVSDAEISILDQNENSLFYTLLFGSDKLKGVKNLCIINVAIVRILFTERFKVPL